MITIPGVASSYDDISDYIMNLKTFSFIDDVYISTISQDEDEAGNIQYAFNLSCVYTNPFASATDAEEE
jgi:type IV pilus assembly protein PilM